MKPDILIDSFKSKLDTISSFTRTKRGKKLLLAAVVIFVILFLSPLFHETVGAMLFGCVAAPMCVLIWRRYDSEHAIVPAVFFCIPMILDMILYLSLTVASCMLVAVFCTILVAIYPTFSSVKKIKDNMYAYLYAGVVCVAIVILASLIMLLVSIVWWLFCLVLFVVFVGVFFSVVLSTAAYTATDAKRQARKKELRQYDLEESTYDFDVFAQDLGIKRDNKDKAFKNSESRRNPVRKKESEKLFYDVDDYE